MGLLLVPALALGHGEAGDHVQEFQAHIDDYQADVAKLAGKLDALAERHARGKDVTGDVEAFVEAWEQVKYHAAVEKVASPLYPAIWQAIGGLRQAVKQDKGPEAVRARAEALTAVLHEGLGGLKLKAQMVRSGEAGQTAQAKPSGGPAAEFARIREELDHAVEEYTDGHTDDAKQHVRDAYFNHFEGLEGRLIEQDAELVAGLEEAFNAELLGLINDNAPADRVRDKVEAMKATLAEAEKLLKQAGEDHGEVF
jgi:uncharacterized protein with von Willebrand factor type A (vWA) domain